MRLTLSKIICLLACFAIALPVLALQRGSDPLSGTWTGDWGPSPGDRNQVNVDLKWDGKAVTGTVRTTDRPSVTLSKSTFDASTGAVHMEADAPNPRGGTFHYVIEGKVANGVMTGSWNHDRIKGDFKLSKK
jgi:hypothetical protein